MPQAHLQADAIGLPTNRRQIEQQIAALIDLLDTLDGDTDLEETDDLEDTADSEPSLGFSTGGHFPEFQRQEGRALHMNANGGDDCEDEHDGAEPSEDAEPDVDDEYPLGWGTGVVQEGKTWRCVKDLEQGVGAVRKKRPPSRTGNRAVAGAEVF